MAEEYNFEAPQFVDFLQYAEDDGTVDTDDWFDQRTEDDHYFKGNHAVKPVPTTPKPTRAATTQKPGRVRTDDGSRPACPSPQKCARICNDDVDPSTPSRNTRYQARLSQEEYKDPTRSGQAKQATSEQKQRAAARQTTAKGSAQKGMVSTPVLPKPKMKVSASTSALVKTSEDLELEKIAAMRAEVARARKATQESYKKTFNSQVQAPLRSIKPATMPQGFHFSTDSRLKKSAAPTTGQNVKDFTATLRDSKTVPKAGHNQHLTRPQPFKLSQPRKPTQVTKFESDAEKIANFSKKTPQRFKSMPKLTEGRSRSSSRGGKSSAGGSNDSRSGLRQSPRLTVAQSPALMSRGRSRPVHAISRDEQERLEFEKHQKEQFKAHPVNHKVLEMPNVGVPKVEPKPLTIPEEFALSRRRSMSTGDLREALRSVEEDQHRFQARPVNPRIFQGTLGIKPAESIPPTVPESPAFALKNRVRMPREPEQHEEPQRVLRAHRVPHVGVPFQPKREHKFTVPEPFQVEQRSKEMLTRRQHKIQLVLEEERKAHEFQASWLPCLEPDNLPPKQPRPATKPEPFDLLVDKRGKEFQEQFRAKQLEEERRIQRDAAKFKAGPNSVIQKKAFQPVRSCKPLTEVDKFHLNTDVRAASREQFDQFVKQHEAEIVALKRRQAEQREAEEKAAVAKLRKEAVHVATGIKKYSSAVIKPSNVPLTRAQSPKFSQRFRTRRGSE